MIQRLPVSVFSLVFFVFLSFSGSRITAQIAFAEDGVKCICGAGATGSTARDQAPTPPKSNARYYLW